MHTADSSDRTTSATPPHPLRTHLRVSLVLMIVVTQVPFLLTIWFSLQNWNLTTPDTRAFVGFANYAKVFDVEAFWPAVRNSAIITFSSVLIVLVLGLLFAVMVNSRFRGRSLARTLLFIPFLVPSAASALMWKNSMLNPTYGLLNHLLAPFGAGQRDWISQNAMSVIVVVSSWQWIPFAMIILLAGLQSQDSSTLEAAKLDGANGWQSFIHFTLPHLRPYIEIAGLLCAIFISQMIDPIVLMTQGGPGTETTTIPYLLYNTAFRGFDVGLSSAMGVLVVLVTVPLTIVILRTMMSVFRAGGGR